MADFTGPLIEGLTLYKEHNQKQQALLHGHLTGQALKNQLIAGIVKQVVDLSKLHRALSGGGSK